MSWADWLVHNVKQNLPAGVVVTVEDRPLEDTVIITAGDAEIRMTREAIEDGDHEELEELGYRIAQEIMSTRQVHDDLVDAVSNETVGEKIRDISSAFSNIPQQGEIRRMPKGPGTYYARFVLSRLGGSFDKVTKLWSLPLDMAALGEEACRLGSREMRELQIDEPQVADILFRAGVRGGKSYTPPSDALGTTDPTALCWECGQSLYGRPHVSGPANFRHGQLKEGAVVAEAYCGCVERGDAKTRHRPRF